MEKFFGVPNFFVVDFDQIPTIEIRGEYQYFIKSITIQDNDANYHYQYSILNNELKPCEITRNGWSLKDFHSESRWHPYELTITILDPDNKNYYSYGEIIESHTDAKKFLKFVGHDASQISKLLSFLMKCQSILIGVII